MTQSAGKIDVFEKLKGDILSLQGFRTPSGSQRVDFGLGPVESAFPNHIFPTGAVHEFLSDTAEDAAATSGFMAGLLGKLMGQTGACLWISCKRTIFPPALKIFGIEPDRVIFIDLGNKKEVLWAIEEALKCEVLSAVVGELNEISFTESRRLQLAVERSRVTGFLHRNNLRMVNTLACVSRWKITPICSELDEDMPGVGFPRWQVTLQKVRNGEPGTWEFEWSAGRFQHLVVQKLSALKTHLQQTG